MTDLTTFPRNRFRHAASRILKTTPFAWLIFFAIPGGLLANALGSAGSTVAVEVWLVAVVVTISLLAMWSRFFAAGAIGRWTRTFWSAASLGVGAGIALTSQQAANPDAHAMPFLAIPIAMALFAPLGGASAQDHAYGPNLDVWTRGSRFVVRLAPLLVLCICVSLFAGLVANMTATTWAGLAALGAFFATLVCSLVAAGLGVFSYSVADSRSLNAPLNGVELQLTEMGFTFAALTTIAGCLGLFAVRAFASGHVLTPAQLQSQALLLIGLSVVGPAALFLGAPFVDGNDRVRGVTLHRLGRLMRLFSPAFVVLFAWSGPAVLTHWAMGDWTDLEQFGVCILGAGTAFCLLRTVFDLLVMRLPLWVLPTTYAAATLGAGVMAL